MTTLSVILPFYDDLARAMRCLNSLQALAMARNEYIVQDDASPNVHGPAVFPGAICSVERNAENMGFAANCNAGAARAQGDVLVFVNQDVYAVYGLSEAWDTYILNAFARSDVAIVGPRLLFPNSHVQSAGGLFDAHGQPFHRCLNYSNREHREVNTPCEVSWVTGAFLAVRASVWQELGGFDTEYRRGYFEDADLCVRAHARAGVVWYEPRATLVHETGTTGGSPHFMANAMRFKTKWVDTGIIQPDDRYVIRERWW